MAPQLRRWCSLNHQMCGIVLFIVQWLSPGYSYWRNMSQGPRLQVIPYNLYYLLLWTSGFQFPNTSRSSTPIFPDLGQQPVLNFHPVFKGLLTVALYLVSVCIRHYINFRLYQLFLFFDEKSEKSAVVNLRGIKGVKEDLLEGRWIDNRNRERST